MMLVSVIIPTQLSINKITGETYLKEAIASVRNQIGNYNIEIITIVDDLSNGFSVSMNTGVDKSKGDIIALLDDDDIWSINKLAIQLKYINEYDLITCNQQSFGDNNEITYYPTPSGWIMSRSTWNKVGGFNPDFRLHSDTEWLGRTKGLKRIHIVQQGADVTQNWVTNIKEVSSLELTGEKPLMGKRIRQDSILGLIKNNSNYCAQSIKEKEQISLKYCKSRIMSLPW